MIPIWRYLLTVLILVLGMGLMGCGKGNSRNSLAFDNAAPEIKEMWSKAVTADKGNDYVAAVTAYNQILAHQGDLTESQYLEAKEAFGLLNQRLVNSSLKGDVPAKQALDTLRKTQLGR